MGRHLLVHVRALAAVSASASMRSGPLRAERGAKKRNLRPDGLHPLAALRRFEPLGGLLGASAVRVDPAPDDGRPGMALEQRRLIQIVEPAGEPFHPVCVRRKGMHRHETRDRVHVSCRGRVPPRGVECAVRLGPHRGPAVHRGNELGSRRSSSARSASRKRW